MSSSNGNLLSAALRYAEMRYPVFPCAPGTNTPLTEHGFLDATSDATLIEQWWTQTPTANIGIAAEGLLVVDVDPVEDGSNPWLKNDPNKQLDLASAPMAITPRT